MLYDDTPDYDLWEVKAYVPFEALENLEDAFPAAVAVLTRLMEEGPYKDLWEFQFFTPEKPDEQVLKTMFKNAYAHIREKGSMPVVTFVPKRDWLKENLLTFEPVEIGPYYIYGQHITTPPPKDKIALCLDAATAFGSGEHQTTQGCLTAMEMFGKKGERVLDLGCGSGILAMAYAKTYQTPVDAVDMDKESVRVARQNVKNNGLKKFVRVWKSKGFEKVSETYDLIFANILARPLVEMSPDMKEHVAPGGHVVLSGFLDTQVDFVLPAYEKKGFKLEKLMTLKTWCTAVLKKK